MSCPNGSRKKQSSPDIVFISSRDFLCATYGEQSFACQYSKYGTFAVPYMILQTEELCNAARPPMPDISFLDVANPAQLQDLLEEAGRVVAWNTYCECTPTQNPPPFKGGQCECIEYRVEYSYNRSDLPASKQVRSNVSWGEIEGVIVEYPTTSSFRISILGRGKKPALCGISGQKATGTSGGIPVGVTIQNLKIESIRREDNAVDTCGDPPGGETPNPNPPTPPPPNFDPRLPPPPDKPFNCDPCAVGQPGEKGEQGEQGIQGEKGEKGDKGDTGLTGIKGDKGDAGVQGERGLTGDRGATGDKGERGEKGDAGLPGVDGRDGLPGSDGAPGRDGIPGERGERGEPGLSIKGDKGDKGEPGIPGEDAKVEFDTVLVSYEDCTPGGELVDKSITFQVIKGDGGSTYELYRHLFQTLGGIDSQLCTIRSVIDDLDLNVGVPMRGYEIPTPQCTVLYFNDARTTGQGVGRYINIPNPNNEEILKWAATDPVWLTGSYYSYALYLGSRGPKVANYGLTPEIAAAQQALLQTFTFYTAAQLHHLGSPRKTTEKLELELRLKRVTHFPGILGQGGQEPGEVIFINRN